jgi:hypothetical protein
MRTEEVRDLLEEASAGIAEPDLADAAWAGGTSIRRRRRRRTAMAAVAVALAVIVAAVLAGPPGGRSGTPVGPTPTVSASATRTVSSTGTISGMPYWVAPQPGAERFLDRIDTPLGDLLKLPPYQLDDIGQKPVIRVAAVLLRRLPGTEKFRPAILSVYGRWAEAPVDLVMTKDSGGNQAQPLDATAVARDGERIAFPQPNEVVVLDATSGQVERIPVPSATIENVAWLPTGDRLLVSGDGAAFLVFVGPDDQAVRAIQPAADPWAVTAPFALDQDGEVPALVRYDVAGSRTVEQFLSAPVSQWYGPSFTAGPLVARAFFSEPVGDLAGRTVSDKPHMVAVIEAAPGAAGKLLILDDATDSTFRFKGCCSVLGWYDDRTVLLESRSGVDNWILGWDVRTGQLRRVTELSAEVVALGPILR